MKRNDINNRYSTKTRKEEMEKVKGNETVEFVISTFFEKEGANAPFPSPDFGKAI